MKRSRSVYLDAGHAEELYSEGAEHVDLLDDLEFDYERERADNRARHSGADERREPPRRRAYPRERDE